MSKCRPCTSNWKNTRLVREGTGRKKELSYVTKAFQGYVVFWTPASQFKEKSHHSVREASE
jgi:hypothetical protein